MGFVSYEEGFSLSLLFKCNKKGRLNIVADKHCIWLSSFLLFVLDIFQAHLPVTGNLFPPLIGLLRQARLDPDVLHSQYNDRHKKAPSERLKKVPAAVRLGLFV